MKTTLKIGARSSPLSQAQVKEVLDELKSYHPWLEFDPLFVKSQGDKDHTVSLRTLGKTDFFTKEIDVMILQGHCRIGIHSAKDLPEPIPSGLEVIAITRGVDPADVLVLAPGTTLNSLPSGALIATSSERREEAVRILRPDLQFCDVRGTIGERLALLERGEVDGVVIAEAALIRLGLTHLNRLRIPGETVPYQGRLAIVAKAADLEMRALFACLDTRKKLYLGIRLPTHMKNAFHYPILKIIPRQPDEAFQDLASYTHLIFTSQTSVEIFFQCLPSYGFHPYDMQKKSIIVIGKKTAEALQKEGIIFDYLAEEETSEGIVTILTQIPLKEAYIFWPHSALSRSVITEYFRSQHLKWRECILYTSVPHLPGPLPDLEEFEEIIFTSPSTVEAFLKFFGPIPSNKMITAIGTITLKRLQFKK
jgi:hydroxymethylbilane synthase